MKKEIQLAVGIALGSLLFQLFKHGYNQIDFARVAFVGVFSFLCILVYNKFKTKPSSSNADEHRQR
jgi:hypothetical protein